MLNFNDYSRLVSKNTNAIEKKPQNLPKKDAEKDKENINSTVLINNPANVISVNKNKLALTLAITGAISATIAVAVCSKKISGLISECSKLKNALDNVPKHTIPDTDNLELTKAQKRIGELEEKIKKLAAYTQPVAPLSEEAEQAIGTKATRYREIISDIETIYEQAEAPKKNNFCIPFYKKIFPFHESTLSHGTKRKNNFIENLIEEFHSKKGVEIPLVHKKTAQEAIESAKIKPKDFAEIGIPQKTSIKVAYGHKVKWSDEKVARDILQNFYDGNNHTLDGVGFLVEELPNGRYKIKISGNGVFDYDRLKLLGDTTKTSDLADAGGFGEGSKIVIANMLASKKTDEVRFRSADWELVFDGKDSGEVIRTTLNKTSEVMDGNCIEFETGNETFVEKIINALNYFRHKDNPDFQDFTFENDEFGFKILNPGEKGNFYLTQRFEFESEDAWEDSVEGLNIIFKKRPDPEKYREIAGHDFNMGRDRSKMTCDDILNLIRCSSDKMSNEALVESILATRNFWQTFKPNDTTPIKSLLTGLLEEANKRNIVVDFGAEKICQFDDYTSSNINKILYNRGYDIIADSKIPFRNICMPTTSDIFRLMSSHEALKPTKKEAQKLKVLEMATGALQRYFSITYVKQLNEIFENLSPKDLKITELEYFITSYIKDLNDLTFDESVVRFSDDFSFNSEQNKIIDVDKFNKQLFEYIQKKIKTITPQNIEDNETKNLFHLITSILEKNGEDNKILQEYAAQLKNINIISQSDIEKPRFIFDRKNELSTSTLGEAILTTHEYAGHWIDRTYLNKGSFQNLLATWLHEICHKSGGDGTAEFTYKLTDMIESLLTISTENPDLQTELMALQKVFDEIK